MAEAALSPETETETLIVAGPPHALCGQLQLRNDTDEKLKVRRLPVRDRADDKSPRKIKAATLEAAARLRPGEQALVPMQLTVNAQTAPGVYQMEVKIGDRALPVQAHVTEHVDFRMEPSAVTLLAGADRVIEREFVAENVGNVALHLGDRCETPLLDSLDFITALREGLRKTVGIELKTRVEKILDEIGRVQVGSLVVHRERVTLRPGERRQMTARFELPEDIKPSRHYRAVLELYNATLHVDIYTTEKAGGSRTAAKKETSK
jgi:hypothetical protein